MIRPANMKAGDTLIVHFDLELVNDTDTDWTVVGVRWEPVLANELDDDPSDLDPEGDDPFRGSDI